MRQYIVNEVGERMAVVLSIEEYERLLDALEDLEDLEHIQAAGETKTAIERGEEEVIPFEQAMREIREGKVPKD